MKQAPPYRYMLNVDQAHSTRLFPKQSGADAYQVTGVAALCDWVLLTDKRPPYTHLVRQSGSQPPRSLFVSLRSPRAAVSALREMLQTSITRPLVLVTGSEDATVPRQVDLRMPDFSVDETEFLFGLADGHPLIHHWFAENLDTDLGPRVEALPVGMVFPNPLDDRSLNDTNSPSLLQRPLKVLCGHRVRKGPQWDTRRSVSAFAQGPWNAFTTCLIKDISESDFLRQIEEHSFVLCVEGGGLDPSPKAWQTILHGAIPIMRRTPTSNAYERLPCHFVEAWTEDALSLEVLERARARIAPAFVDAQQRAQVVERLGLGYWWTLIKMKINELEPTGPF